MFDVLERTAYAHSTLSQRSPTTPPQHLAGRHRTEIHLSIGFQISHQAGLSERVQGGDPDTQTYWPVCIMAQPA